MDWEYPCQGVYRKNRFNVNKEDLLAFNNEFFGLLFFGWWQNFYEKRFNFLKIRYFSES